MNRAQEHAAYASNLAADAVADLGIEHTVAAYKKLQQARLELAISIAHIQRTDPEAVFEANRVIATQARQHIRAEATAALQR